MGKKVNSLFDIHATAIKRIDTILKIVIEFVYTQMTQPQTKFFISLIPFWLQHLRKLLEVGLINLRTLFLKKKQISSNTKTFKVLDDRIQLVPFNEFRWKESAFEKNMFNFDERNIMNISCNIINILLVLYTTVMTEVVLSLALSKCSLQRCLMVQQLFQTSTILIGLQFSVKGQIKSLILQNITIIRMGSCKCFLDYYYGFFW